MLTTTSRAQWDSSGSEVNLSFGRTECGMKMVKNFCALGDIQKQVSHLNFVHLLDLTGFLQIDKLFRD